MGTPLYPALYQVNTRVWLTGLAQVLGRPATLDDVPDAALDQFRAQGFDWIWLLSVWSTGPAGKQVARADPGLRREYQEALPDLSDADIAGSGFAIDGYTVHPALGGDAALARLRERLRRRGLRLMLDFAPNHTALDHPWVQAHPEYYVAGSAADLARAPQDYVRLALPGGERILAHGRDPNFPGWTDTLQLDYGNPDTHLAMQAELQRIAAQCDGLRCDMAMLLLPEVFRRTWGRPMPPFWPQAIAAVRARRPDFCLLAEVYWDLEWSLLQQGFDYAYDKRLYDRLRAGQARPLREHLAAPLRYQDRLARFLENHDEPRAAAAFAPGQREAAAVLAYLSPGLRFFHQGQLEGRRKRIPVQLVRAPEEAPDPAAERFYRALCEVLRQPPLRDGQWQLLDCAPAWDGNGSWDGFVAALWQSAGGARRLVAVNYAAHQGQCYLRLPLPDLDGRPLRLKDLMGPASYDRDGGELLRRGLYLDLPAWGYHVFELLTLA